MKSWISTVWRLCARLYHNAKFLFTTGAWFVEKIDERKQLSEPKQNTPTLVPNKRQVDIYSLLRVNCAWYSPRGRTKKPWVLPSRFLYDLQTLQLTSYLNALYNVHSWLVCFETVNMLRANLFEDIFGDDVIPKLKARMDSIFSKMKNT